ncbi:prepilin-type N-terminal cleavage/methylation domain-containing protein [Candidatus Clostridium radicumherbarum]|uniref:Prepilin-type N-terminal cleavage/methylation domain-containing protein n=1 Tax=Candidatus Clostridium radicumherbarum TaxID=3381662 RepID=A0ABW8TSX1_9CLOT
MKFKGIRKGLTLIEVIISIAILGIIAVSFLSMFSNGYINIFTMGNKSKAVVKAQSAIDSACSAGRINYATDPDLNGMSSSAASVADLHTFSSGIESKYFIENVTINSVLYKRITVAVFYQGGQRYVELTSLIP